MTEPSSYKPFISVVIPTYDRPRQLSRCLNALTRVDYPRNSWEVIVVDDGSPQPLRRVVAAFERQLNIKLVRQQNSGAGSARNTGAKHARGSLLAFTDDDCQPPTDWLNKIAGYANEDAAIGGITANSLPDNVFATTSQVLMDFLYGYYHPSNQNRFFASNNLIVQKNKFEKIGGFDTTFARAGAEDRDLCRRWIQAGYSTVLAKDVIVFHEHRMGAREFLRQHWNYGRGAFNFHRMRAKENSDGRIRIEPLTFYFGLLTHPLRHGCRHKLAVFTLLFLSQAANAAGFFYELFTRRKSDAAENISVTPIKQLVRTND